MASSRQGLGYTATNETTVYNSRLGWSVFTSRSLYKVNARIPARDTGIDLLVTDSDNLHAVSLQVKYGKDFLPEMKAELRSSLRL